ncbi:MAG: type II toxin-antitoxin system RelE/ParE family toxin [Lacunisphaera sp.]|nr:type II toxin-antitoxin system RelE/ParE family toxin [Lacunisphaera sp.]
MRILAVSSRAESEITKAALWYGQQRSGLGHEFLSEIDIALSRLTANPLLYPVVRHAPDVRRIRLDRFPWHVWFYVEADTIRIFAVLHAKRDPQNWQKRV